MFPMSRRFVEKTLRPIVGDWRFRDTPVDCCEFFIDFVIRFFGIRFFPSLDVHLLG